MAKRVLAAGRLFGMDGPARIKVAPSGDVVRAHASSRWSTLPLDAAFTKADRKLMSIVHASRSRRRG